MKNNPLYNSEGYPDPTAYNAVKKISQDERIDTKAAFLINIIKFIIRESGFKIVNRIEIQDKTTGRIFK